MPTCQQFDSFFCDIIGVMSKKALFLLLSLICVPAGLKFGLFEIAASFCITPVIRSVQVVASPIKNFFKNRRSYSELEKYCIYLKNEREELLRENTKLQSVARYAEKSSDIREFSKRHDLKNALLSKVLIKTLTPNEHSFILNRGSRDGVNKDMVAIYKFQMLGRVTKVFPYYCKVTLVTDHRSKISAYANTSNTRGIVEGENVVNSCSLNYISHLKSIHDNDLVFSSGEGLVFPEGFCLGKIARVTTKKLFHKVDLQPLVDFRDLEVCHLTGISKMNIF